MRGTVNDATIQKWQRELNGKLPMRSFSTRKAAQEWMRQAASLGFDPRLARTDSGMWFVSYREQEF